MKIVDKKKKLTVSELEIGDCFIYNYESPDELFLVISNRTLADLDDKDFPVLAVSLTGNYLMRFQKKCEVEKVDAEVVINER